jgi:hypothetical protein
MSAREDHTKHDAERDPALDAAWREASREQPPAALDDAIRAAARREVGAAPRRPRDKHWWYPLAAAATVAVIAVGLLQLSSTERVTPIVAEKPTAPAPAQREPSAAPAMRSDTAVAPAEPIVAPAKKDARAEPPARSGGSIAAFPQPAPRTKIETQPMDQLARAEPGTASGSIAPPAPPASAPAPRGEPFPATPPAAAAAPQREAAASEERQMRVQTAMTRSASDEAAKPKQAATRSVEDWIKLIRDLRTEGKTAEAGKELAAFRDAFGERADSLLPQDLREFKPPEPAGAK